MNIPMNPELLQMLCRILGLWFLEVGEHSFFIILDSGL